MKQKLIAVAVVGAFAAPAAFAQSTVQIYGSINAEYGFVSAPDAVAGAPGRNNYDGFDSGASNIGFKGEEKLGGGMSAFFQCESDVRFLAGATRTSGSICDRNSAIGLKGGFGSFFVGTWDSPNKIAVGKTRMLADTGFLGVTHMTFDEFSNRNAYSINYHSPNFNGFQVLAQTTSTNDANGTAVPGKKGRLNSLAGTYTSGPLTAALGWTKADDNKAAGTVSGAEDTSVTAGVTYTFGPAKLGFTWYDANFEDPATLSDIERNAYNLALSYSLGGANSILAGYTRAGDFEGTVGGVAIPGDNGAKEYQISFIHALSKRTTTAIGYARLKNDGAGDLYTVGNRVSGTGQRVGAKSSVITVQLKHAF